MYESPNPATGNSINPSLHGTPYGGDGLSKEHTSLSTQLSTGRLTAETGISPRYLTALLDTKQWLNVQRQYSLTQREREIAELICQGLRNERIADHLSITSGTVKTHIRNIYRKIHVKNKIGMLLRFVAASRELSAPLEEAMA